MLYKIKHFTPPTSPKILLKERLSSCHGYVHYKIKNGCKYSWAVELAYILKLKRKKIGIFLCQQT